MSTIKTTHRVTKSNTHRVFVDAEPGHSWRYTIVSPDGMTTTRAGRIPPEIEGSDLGTLMALLWAMRQIPANSGIEIVTTSKTIATIGYAFATEPLGRYFTGFSNATAKAAWDSVPDTTKARWPDVLHVLANHAVKWLLAVADDAGHFETLEQEATKYLATEPSFHM